MEDVPQLLLELTREAQRHPPRSPKRQRALNKLVNQILKSNLLGHPQKAQWPPDTYEELYREALQKTCLEICTKINTYKPEHPVMAWVNFTLKYRFSEAVREFREFNEVNNKKVPILSLDDLDKLNKNILLQEPPSAAKLLRQFLEEDPENIFKSEHVKGHPEATYQALAIAKFVDDKTWEQIYQEFGIGIPTLSSFVARRTQKFKPYFHKYLQE